MRAITKEGLLLVVDGEELSLPFDDLPWFRNAPVAYVLDVERPAEDAFHWPHLDVDLCLDGIRRPHRYPLKAKMHRWERVEAGPRENGDPAR